MSRRLRLGTRGSRLAMWQAHWARRALQEAHPGLEVEIVEVHSHGDRDTSTPLQQLGAVGIFTKAIEDELLAGRCDVAVHSLKDVPSELAPGTALVATSRREDPRDALFAHEGGSLATLPHGARVATGSLRRRSQLRARRPDLELVDLRGNLDTRWAKFERHDFDAMLLAVAGVVRMGWGSRITARLELDEMLPAVGQGIVGLQVREGDPAQPLVAAVADSDSWTCAVAERSMMATVGGGCIVPLAGLARLDGDYLTLEARLGSEDGQTQLALNASGPRQDPEGVGRRVGEGLLEMGAAELVAAARGPGAGGAEPA